ncbi:MAG: UDP-N-acetylmuramate dehydrogenase [Candidatus Dojkabacteria bacterium]|jgi:UDP-N-acetylmuramate dehydrogenase|nr:UDP-N-acetylmuramate dehydrogenase [Candidatus Dojkabacteria bacterium]
MRLEYDKSLKKLNTFKVDIKSKLLLTVEDDREFNPELLDKYLKDNFYILGEGSNTLFTKDFDGTVLLIRNKGIRIVEKDSDYILVEVSAGENWNDFVNWSIDNKFIGLQNLVDIPGNVGASPIQNIGAYGPEVKDFITEVQIYDIERKGCRTLSNKECDFGYRDSIFKNHLKGKVIVKSVTFKLERYKGVIDDKYLQYSGIQDKLKGKKPTLRALALAVKQIREEKLPCLDTYGSCGSTFKNLEIELSKYKELEKRFVGLPMYETKDSNIVKIPTAYILEKLGWKNKREGNVGTWTYHPLIVTNYGNATAQEIHSFILKMQNDFKFNTGLELETEINII